MYQRQKPTSSSEKAWKQKACTKGTPTSSFLPESTLMLNHFFNHVGPIDPCVISSNDGGSYEFIGNNFPELIYAENEQKQNYKHVYAC